MFLQVSEEEGQGDPVPLWDRPQGEKTEEDQEERTGAAMRTRFVSPTCRKMLPKEISG